jgi:hypothetical protein
VLNVTVNTLYVGYTAVGQGACRGIRMEKPLMLLKDSEWLPRLVAAEYRSFAEQPSLVARLADHAAALFADLAGC